MSRLLIIVLVAAAAVSSAQAGSTLKPPVIHEAFTVLPCPAHRQTTLALEGCAEKVHPQW